MTASAARSAGPTPSGAGAAPPVDRRVLVLIGGLPGSGKTRLLGRLLAPPAAARGLDSEQVAAALHRWGLRLPYRVLRSLVHLVHRLRVRVVARSRSPVVVAPEEARRGQIDRRRSISDRSMDRHVRRWRAALQRFTAPDGVPGATAVVVVDRTAAAGLTLSGILDT